MILVIKRLLFTIVKQLVLTLAMCQRIVFVLLCLIILLPLFLVYKLTTHHYTLIQATKSCIKVFFWINGIKLIYDKKRIHTVANEMIWANYFSAIEHAILFAILPYKSIHFMPKAFFQKNIFKALFYTLGVYPEEKDFDFRSYKTSDFMADPYAKAGFNLVQSVHVKRQEVDPIPYALMIALKHSLSILFLRFHHSERAKFASFLTPVRIEIKIHDELTVGRRPEILLHRYRTILKDLEAFESSRRTFVTADQRPEIKTL